MSRLHRWSVLVAGLVGGLLLEGVLLAPAAQEDTTWVFTRATATQRPASFQLGDQIYYSQVFPIKAQDWGRIRTRLADQATEQVGKLVGPGWHVEVSVSHSGTLREAEERRRRNIVEDQDTYRIRVRYFELDYTP
jgi:hypothetical protein